MLPLPLSPSLLFYSSLTEEMTICRRKREENRPFVERAKQLKLL